MTEEERIAAEERKAGRSAAELLHEALFEDFDEDGDDMISPAQEAEFERQRQERESGEVYERALSIVRTWPEWKQGIVGEFERYLRASVARGRPARIWRRTPAPFLKT